MAVSIDKTNMMQVLSLIPERGEFPKTTLLSQVSAALTIELSIGSWIASPQVMDWQEKRYMEAKICTLDRKVSSSSWICSGTNATLKKFISENLEQRIQAIVEEGMEHIGRMQSE